MPEIVEGELTDKMRQARATSYLRQAPDLTAHILTQVSAFTVKAADGMPRGSGNTPIPLRMLGGGDDLSTPLEDANSLYAQLVNWTTSHARSLYTFPPASVLGWFRADRDCDGFPSWATPADSAQLVKDVSTWLIGGREAIAGLAVARYYFDDVRDIMQPLLARYPMAPRKARPSTRECPVCGKHTLEARFGEGDTVEVKCMYCGHRLPHSEVEQHLEEARSADV